VAFPAVLRLLKSSVLLFPSAMRVVWVLALFGLPRMKFPPVAEKAAPPRAMTSDTNEVTTDIETAVDVVGRSDTPPSICALGGVAA
jgi:hypothetical protein